MTHFLQDVLRQPVELQRTIEFLCGAGHHSLRAAAAMIRKARHVYLTGIGSSWHAALCAGPIFQIAAHPVYMQDASELLQFAAFPPGAVVIAISRSGRSIEIVNLLAKARESGATVIGLTNSPDGPLAREAQVAVVVPIQMDHAISVNTYSTLAAAAGVLATLVVSSFDADLARSLIAMLAEVGDRLTHYQEQVAESAWLPSGRNTYFLARGGSLGSCYEARLLWEEGAKSPATAMATGSFRHGPQEMVNADVRFGMWIDAQRMRAQDLSVARDLRRLGASVMLIGQDLPADHGDLVFQLPKVLPEWQFLIDIIPAQFAAEALARRSGMDCDSFRICSYIVEDEYGLMGEVTIPKFEK
jgi:glucosamine--fructose-6-phosphate aminotransferase (isomerizing)